MCQPNQVIKVNITHRMGQHGMSLVGMLEEEHSVISVVFLLRMPYQSLDEET